MSLNRVILTTGGTGGHIFPALAVAEELRRRNPRIKLLFLGGSGPEGELARKHGIEFQELPAKGIMGRGLSGLLSGIGWLATGLPKARAAVKRFGPDTVIGFGGYAGFCPVLAAALAGIPTAVHEQNSVPGVTNKVLGKFVTRAFLSFPDVLGVFPAGKTTLTGNPVRRDIADVAERRKMRTPGRHVLIVGGSQGAHPLNEAVLDALPMLMETGVTLVHQTGKTDFQRVRSFYESLEADPDQTHAFIEDMASQYARADLIVCRAGASTVFEVAAAGVPAIFVPFPQATNDHQTMNAKAIADTGAALLLPQKGMSGASLGGLVLEMLGDAGRLSAMETAARSFSKRDAAADIAEGLAALAA